MIKFVGGRNLEYAYINGKDNPVMTYNAVIEKDTFEVKESHKYFYNHNNIYMDNIGDGVYKITSRYAEPEKNYESNYISDIISPKTIFDLTLMDDRLEKPRRGINLVPVFIKGKEERYYIDINMISKVMYGSKYTLGITTISDSFTIIKI